MFSVISFMASFLYNNCELSEMYLPVRNDVKIQGFFFYPDMAG